MAVLKSISFFLLAGFCEIGGGYLVWLWFKEGKALYYGLTGFILLAVYGLVAALQSSNFGRVYASYGGIFILLALLWGWKVDGIKPDKYDLVGAMIALFGVAVMMYFPRK